MLMSRLIGIVASIVSGTIESKGRAATRGPRRCVGAGRFVILTATVFLAWNSFSSAEEGESPQVIRRETSELRFVTPYHSGKVPVVFIHGLFGNDHQWSTMIEKLSDDGAVCARFQFLTFRYGSTSPIPDSGRELALALDEARQKLDPTGGDPAFEHVVLVGHSLGGLVAKSASHVLDRKRLELHPSRTDRGEPPRSPRIGRHVFIATPHRGAPINQGAVHLLGRQLAKGLNGVHAAEQDPLSSVDQLVWEHPLLDELEKTRAAENVPFHSIIAALGDPTIEGATDGVVPVKSAKIEGARSEFLVQTHHLCIWQAEVIREVGKILSEHRP
jgi:pimeloyl-ACP methyl ester carboxylesterase